MADPPGTVQGMIRAITGGTGGIWQAGDDARRGHLRIGDLRVAVLILGTEPGSAPGGVATPRLREDRVAQRVLTALESAVSGRIPPGRAVVATLGAPIRVPLRLIADLTDRLTSHLARGTVESDEAVDLLGNRVRYRVLRDGAAWTSPMNGFVFTGDPDPAALATAMAAWHRQLTARLEPGAPLPPGPRWLVLARDGGIGDRGTHRRLLSRLAGVEAYARILLVGPDGVVEALDG